MIYLSFLTLALILVLVRFYLGPSKADRALVFDLFSNIMMGCAVILAIALNQAALLSGALVFSILSFVGTAFVAYYIERSEEDSNKG